MYCPRCGVKMLDSSVPTEFGAEAVECPDCHARFAKTVPDELDEAIERRFNAVVERTYTTPPRGPDRAALKSIWLDGADYGLSRGREILNA